MEREQLTELLYQSLETELGGVQVYTTAVECALNEDLKEEWEKYLEQTRNHVEIMEHLLTDLGLDPGGRNTRAPGGASHWRVVGYSDGNGKESR